MNFGANFGQSLPLHLGPSCGRPSHVRSTQPLLEQPTHHPMGRPRGFIKTGGTYAKFLAWPLLGAYNHAYETPSPKVWGKHGAEILGKLWGLAGTHGYGLEEHIPNFGANFGQRFPLNFGPITRDQLNRTLMGLQQALTGF